MRREEGAVQLTREQAAVVEAIVGGSMVVAKAGAGSGKTRTLVEGYARLLENLGDAQNPFDRILAITFTNEGAYKLKKSIYLRTGGDVRALLTDNIATIHSFCNTVISSHLIELSINPAYEIIEEALSAESAYGIIDEIATSGFATDSRLREIIAYYGYEGTTRDGFREMVYGIYCSMRMQGIRQEDAEETLKQGTEHLLKFLHGPEEEGSAEEPMASGKFIKQVTETLGKYVLSFWRAFERAKRGEGRITFDDVLYYTYLLLRDNPEIRSHYRDRFKYILMDEFQDTDRLQFEIVRMISRDGRQALVGDVKQSIYEWRNADPSIMGNLEEQIRQEGKGSVLELTENFRSSPQLIGFFNLLFPLIFDGSPVTYSPMRHANTSVTDSTDPAVRILLPGGSNAASRRKNEAELICAEVKRLLSSETLIFDDEQAAYRKPMLRDVAILFRSRSPVWTYERALREHGIPFIHVQSESFFEKDEIVDLMNYLNHLADPSDTFCTFSSLRSPLFGCSDELLLSLAQTRFDLRKTLENAKGDDRQRLALFIELDRHCSARMNAPAHEVISEITKRTGVDLVYLASAGGKQAYANILKLVDMARGMERTRQVGLLEAIRRLNRRAESGQGESEYPLNDEKSDALRIMTVHASKGQEFPIVFIADSSRGRQNDIHSTFFHRTLGVVPGPPRRTGDRFAEVVEELNMKASIERLEKSEQEDRRVLYVALTRARQLLYISHFDIGGRQDRSWNGLLSRLLPTYAGSTYADLQGVCPIMFVKQPVLKEEREARGIPKVTPVLLERKRTGLTATDIRVNATELSSFMICPYRLKLASGAASDKPLDKGIENMKRGMLAHLLLEDFNYATNSLPSNEGLLMPGKEELISTVKKFVESEFGLIAARAYAAGKLKREFPFTMRLGRHAISGKADLVAEDGGQTMIVDYKTGDVRGHRQEYGNQLMTYALAIHKLNGLASFRLVTFALDHVEHSVDRTIGGEELRLFELQLDTSLQEMAQDVRPAKPSRENCSGCHFADSCEYRFSGQGRLGS